MRKRLLTNKSLQVPSFTKIFFRFQLNWEINAKGFQMEYLALKPVTRCGGNYTNASGVFSSPSHPNPYPNLADCVYLISQPNGSYVNISFLSMHIACKEVQTSDGLKVDYIEMRDGNSEDSPLMARYCGNSSNVPDFMHTTQNHLRVRYFGIIQQSNNFSYLPTISDSPPTLLRVALDFSSSMNQQICLPPCGAT